MGRRGRKRSPRRRRWWVRLLVGLGVTLAVLGLVVVGLVALVVGTSAGTGWALRHAVAWYDGRIPGHVALTSSDGALASGVCLRGLRLADARDQPLVTAAVLCLHVRLPALVGGAVELETLSLVDATLHLWPDAAWGDLAPPSPPPPPGELPGPDLPLRITGPLVIAGLDVLAHGDGEEAVLVRDAWVHAVLTAEGRRASVDVKSVWGQVPAASTAVLAGHAVVQWSSPVVTVEQLGLVSSFGIVQAVRGRLDVLTLRHDAEVRATAFVPATASTPALQAPVTLQLDGSREAAAMHATVVAPGLGRAELSAIAALAGELGVSAFVHAVPEPSLGIPAVHAGITAHAPEHGPLRARLQATAPGAVVTASWDGTRARARALVDGASVQASATVEDGQLRGAEALVHVTSAAHATAALARLLPIEVPSLAGAGRVAATCRVAPQWSCALAAAVERDADRLEATATVHMGEPLEIELLHLAGRLRGEPVRLAEPARVSVDEGSVSLTPLRVAVAGGAIEAAGRVAWQGASDLEVRLSRIDLAVVPRFVPGVPIRGRLSGSLVARGDASHPSLRAVIDVERLGWGREALGGGELRAQYDDHRARAALRWRRGATRVRARVDVPLALALEPPAMEWREHARVRADLEVRRLALADVAEWVDGPALGGLVSATVRVAGSLRDPIVEAELTGTDLRVEDELVGRATLAATARDGEVWGSLDLRGPAIDSAHVEVTLPLALRPTRGGVEYRARGRHRVEARLTGLELARLEPWLAPAFGGAPPELAGLVRGELEASAEAGVVRGRVELLARELVAVGYDVGVTRAVVELGDGQARASVVVSGPWARYIGIDASMPLALAGPLEALQWSPDAPIVARVELVDVELAGIGRLGPGPAIGGELAGTIDLAGTLRRPALAGQLTIDGLSHGGKALGDVRLGTGYDGEALTATLEHRHGAATIVAAGRVPLGVDLVTPSFAWHREQPHRLSVRGQGIDQDLVGLLVELPDDLRFSAAARIEARGTATTPRAAMRLRGHVDGEEGTLPLPVAVHLDVERDRQEARVMLGAHGPVGLVVEAHAAAPLATLLMGQGDPSAVEVDVVARARSFHLRELSPFLPASLHDPRGRLELDASLRGPLASPRLAGRVELHDGAITVIPLRQRFDDIRLRARLDGPKLVLEQLQARSAEGTATATARLHLERGHTRGSGELITRKLPVVRPGLPAMRLDLRLRADVDATGDVTAIALTAHDGFLDVLAVSPLVAADPIPEDDGVVYVDAEGLGQRQRQRDGDQTPWLPEDMVFSLALADPLRVRGPSAEMDWTGRFALERRADEPPQASGTFRTQGGRVSLLGDDFVIESASIRFPEVGDLDPYIDLVATTDTEEALVAMHVRGRMSRPLLELRSEPPMPESDIFALLITGHADASQTDDRELSAKAASVLAAVNNPALQRHLRDTVGIDRVGVGFGETVEQPIVTVGKRIDEKLYLEAAYHHNAPRGTNEAEVRLEYRFAPPRWSVETFFGDAAQGGVGLWWNRRFSTPAQRRAERQLVPPVATPNHGDP